MLCIVSDPFHKSIQQLYCYSIQYHMRHNLAFAKGQNYPSQCKMKILFFTHLSTTYMAYLLKKKVVISDCHFFFYIRKLCVPFFGFERKKSGGAAETEIDKRSIRGEREREEGSENSFLFSIFRNIKLNID